MTTNNPADDGRFSPEGVIASAGTIGRALEPSEPRGLARIQSVDLYRGIIMVIMLLDHVRERVHFGGMTESATNAATSTPLLYFTRWITHLCAPAFVFLAGTSAGLMRQRGISPAQISRYLFTRGLVLVVLEIFVVRPLVLFNVNPTLFAWLETIFAIGISMIALSLLVRLPARVTLIVGLTIVFGHNLLDSVRVAPWTGASSPMPSFIAKLWMVLHQGGLFPLPLYSVATLPGPIVIAGYPVLPWIGVIALGYCLAELYGLTSERRVRVLVALGVSMIIGFALLRFANVYGDTSRWKSMSTPTKTLFSFFDLQKYPPSLLFLLITLAPCLLSLAVFDAKPLTSTVSRWFMTFGRVPMFFFLIQWPWVHFAGAVVALAYGQPIDSQFASLTDYIFGPQPKPSGGPLWLVYLSWALGALLLYFPCRWYGNLRARRRDIALLRYL